MGTVIVAAVLGGLVFLSLRSILRNRKSGGCCGDCSKCHGCGK